MKVKLNDRFVAFKNIDLGEVFREKDFAYMRITAIEDSNYDIYNAVCLYDGTLENFTDTTMVEFCPNAELSLG